MSESCSQPQGDDYIHYIDRLLRALLDSPYLASLVNRATRESVRGLDSPDRFSGIIKQKMTQV